MVATTLVEKLGTATGFPFGEYDYTGALQPTVVGVPVIVPLAWFAMGVTALEVGHRARLARRSPVVVGGGRRSRRGTCSSTPRWSTPGYWEWAVDGAYHGIPLSNYAGWLLTGARRARRRRVHPPLRRRHRRGLLWLYTWWAVMSAIGFVVFFGEPFVGLVGGLGMGAVTALAWSRAR